MWNILRWLEIISEIPLRIKPFDANHIFTQETGVKVGLNLLKGNPAIMGKGKHAIRRWIYDVYPFFIHVARFHFKPNDKMCSVSESHLIKRMPMTKEIDVTGMIDLLEPIVRTQSKNLPHPPQSIFLFRY